MKAWDNYIPLLAHNPHYAKTVREVFGDSEMAFRTLNHYAIRPIPLIREGIEFYRKERFDGKHVIGLQMRTFFMSKTQIETFWGCARFLASKAPSGKEVIFFLATDQPGVRGLAKKALEPYGKLSWTKGKITRATPKGIQMAMADLMLLEEVSTKP